MKHNWFPLCSDINTHWADTYYWWRCPNCKKETKHTKRNEPKPSDEYCQSEKENGIFPLSSI